AAGTPLWTPDGVAVTVLPGTSQDDPAIVSDTRGGIIVTWEDRRSDENDVYAQRVNGAGVPQWTPNGVALCVAPGKQANTKCVEDGTGGAIVVWQDVRSGLGTDDVYARRSDGAGVPQWTDNGVPLCPDATK